MRLVDCFIEPVTFVLDVVKKPESFPDYDAVRAKAEKLLNASAGLAAKLGVSAKDFQDGRFAVCAWIDEAVLGSAWAGREQWLHQPLQRVLFDTVNAGEEYFQRLDERLRQAGVDPDGSHAAGMTSVHELGFDAPADCRTTAQDLAFGPPDETDAANPAPFAAPPEADGVGVGTRGVLEIYALTLMLGFTGKHFTPDAQPTLHNLGRLAKQTALALSGKALAPEGLRLCPPLYGQAEAPGARRRRFWRGLDLVDMLVIGLPLIMLAAMFYAYGSILTGALSKLWGGS